MMVQKKNAYRHFVWIALAYVVIWSALYALSFIYPIDVYSNRAFDPGFILLSAMAALALSYLQWVAVWLVFGPRPYLLRLVLALIASVIGLGVFWGVIILSTIEWGGGGCYAPPNPDLFEGFKFSFSIFPLCFLVVQLPSGLVRWALGWQMNPNEMPAGKHALSIFDLMIVTSLIASAVASLSWTDNPESERLGLVIPWMVMLFLFVLPITYFTMTPWRPTGRLSGRKMMAFIIYVCLIPVGLVVFSEWFNLGQGMVPLACFMLVFLLSQWLGLWMSRRAGWRLWTRWSKRVHRLGNVRQEDGRTKEDPVVVEPFQ